MNRIDKILNHNLFIEYLNKNKQAEADRRFCHHTMEHFLDVARIGMILNLQEKLEIPKDILYGAALLHDIGRFRQYEDGTPHEQASALLAPVILRECGYSEKETGVIIQAIVNHRNTEIAGDKTLDGILYRADKASRPCFCCEMESECNWKKDKKNRELVW